MRSDCVVALAVVGMLFMAGGCSVTRQTAAPPPVVSEQERSFAGALEYLRGGREQQARELLERVVTLPPVSGITDEALFRLALLGMRDEAGKVASQTLELLERLEGEFPRSIWAHQAAPLSAYLAGVRVPRDRQKELKSLRDLNLSLSRDNRELRQTIERLKSLDLELDQKIRR